MFQFSKNDPEWIEYTLECYGNKDKPKDEQVRCEYRRETMTSRFGVDKDADDLADWRDKSFAYLKGERPDVWQQIQNLPAYIMVSVRRFCDNTRNWQNVTIDGAVLTEPARMVPYLGVSNGALAENPIGEMNKVIDKASTLFGDDLKNFVRQCDGLDTQESNALPVKDQNPPQNANTQAEQNAP